MVETTTPKETGVIHVLHVDDDTTSLEISRLILAEMGNFEIDQAHSVDEALKKLKEKNYDIIVSDYEMPQKSGLDFLKTLREQKNNIPFALFTGKGREDVAITALNLGADGYFNKQGSPETVYGELAYGIKKSVERKRAETALLESETKFRLYVEHSPVAVFVTNKDGKYEYVNQAGVEMLGYSLEELQTMTFSQLLFQENPEFAKNLFASREKSTFQGEIRLKTKGGRAVFLNQNGVALANGKRIAFCENITERKKMETLLLDSEERFRQLFSKMPSGGAIYSAVDDGADFVFKDLNESAERIEKVSRGQVVGNCLTQLFPGARDFGILDVFQRVYQTGAPEFFPIKLYCDGGNTGSWRENWVFKLPNGDLVAIYNDVTERKKAEEEVRQSEETYRELINGMNDTAWVIDSDANFVDVNDAAVKVLGYSRAELLNMGPADIDSSLSKAEISNLVRHMPSDEKQVFETTHHTKDGRILPVEISSSLIMYRGKQVVLSIARDITERNKLNDALRKSYARFDEVMQHVEEFVWEIDVKGVYTYASSAVQKILGYTPDEVVGKKRFYDFFLLDEKEELKNTAFSVFEKKEPFKDFVNRNIAKNGSIVWLSTSGVPIVTDDGKLLGYRGADTNITESKEMEARLATYARLQAAVAELGQYALSQTSLNVFINKAVLTVSEALQVEYCKILELLPDGNALLLRAGVGWKDGLVGKATVPAERQSQAGYTLLSKEAIIVEDLKMETRFSGPPLLLSHNVVSGLSVIIGNLEKPFGVLGAHSIRRRHFSEDDAHFMQSIANLIAEFIERKNAEDTLQASEAKYRDFTDSLPQIVFEADANGKVVYANKGAYEVTGYTKEDLEKGLYVFDLVAQEGKQNAKENFRNLLTGLPFKENEYSFFKKDGSTFPVIVRSKPIYIENRIAGIRGIVLDITERKKSEELLQASVRKYREFAESLPGIAFELDINGNAVFVNSRASQLTGYSQEELSSNFNVIQFIAPLDRERALVDLRRINSGEIGGPLDYNVLRKDGSIFPTVVWATPILSQNRVVGVRGIVVDNTERKKAENALNQTMDQLVLMNEKLNVVGSLTRHDIRNKLSTVAGTAYLLKKKHRDEPDIVEGINRIEQAIKDTVKIFEFAKLYEQLGVEKLTYVDAERALNEAIALCSGLNLNVINDCHGLHLLADSCLRQLFYNFLDNTIKHGKEATKAKVYFERAQSGELRLIYEDDGVGILAENKQRLFTEGFSTGGSTGFGLFLIGKMMRVYGWGIVEDGAPGKGSKFTMTVPLLNKYGKENFQITP